VSLSKRLKKGIHLLLFFIKNRIKRAQFYLYGFRADASTAIAWSVSADAGGQFGRIAVGKNSALDIGVILRANGNSIIIGNNTSVNPYCIIHGSGGIKIGNGVRIASHTVIVAANHIYADTTKFIYLQGESQKGIVIEDDVWIGAGARILDGVIIGRGSVIGAGAVVTKSTPPLPIVVGVPGKILRMRDC
jgi:acetyltransferase-like isoleucine patch superfamily enzyme